MYVVLSPVDMEPWETPRIVRSLEDNMVPQIAFSKNARLCILGGILATDGMGAPVIRGRITLQAVVADELMTYKVSSPLIIGSPSTICSSLDLLMPKVSIPCGVSGTLDASGSCADVELVSNGPAAERPKPQLLSSMRSSIRSLRTRYG